MSDEILEVLWSMTPQSIKGVGRGVGGGDESIGEQKSRGVEEGVWVEDRTGVADFAGVEKGRVG